MLNIYWNKCDGGNWCSFENVDLDHSHFNGMEGVYIIWQGGGPIVRVGQGVIRDRIADHRNDKAINFYNNLFVTWARVSTQNRDGVERYLAETLNPKVGFTFPDTSSIAVNLPNWG
jgi:hypothetical protein